MKTFNKQFEFLDLMVTIKEYLNSFKNSENENGVGLRYLISKQLFCYRIYSNSMYDILNVSHIFKMNQK